MKAIADIFAGADSAPISFEIFPPKGELSVEQARGVAQQLAPLDPSFISVTYSAGGSGNSGATAQIAQMIQDDFQIPMCAHLTCINSTAETVDAAMADMKARGIRNVLALRGDYPADPALRVENGPFHFAKDLIPLLREQGFCVGAAAYPEGHVDCMDFGLSIEHLKQKQDAGAEFFVSQLFFDNELFYRFQEAADAAGITVPTTAGIMPFLGKSQIQRMVFMCGASLPSKVIKLLAKYENSDADLRKAGIEYACQQLVDLQEHGADGLHVYCMNHADIAAAAMSALRK